MFLCILNFKIENKKLFRENCFENVVSDLWNKRPMRPQNYFLKKGQKLKTAKN